MSKKLFFILLVVCLAAVGPAFAQLTPEGRINGKVVDNQGNPLPGVSVSAASPKLIGKAVATTDAAGVYRLMALPSGAYEITFTIQGFKTLIRKGILLELSQTLALNVTLEEATVEEQVTVIGKSPLIDVKSTVKGQTMTKETYLTLPRGRAFDSLISTIPGVQNEDVSAGISVDGASGAENVWFADGADMTDFHLGTKGQNVVLELLDEVKVTASGYNAEFGGSMGGVINVITRSGGNQFHGDILAFYENNSQLMQGYSRDYLQQNIDDYTIWEYANNDTDYFNGGKDRDSYNRYELVFSLGGYIIKDKLWFFGSLNPVYYKTAALRDFNYREGPFSTFTNTNHDYNGSLRLTAAPLKGFRLSASYINNFTKYLGAVPSIQGYDDENYQWAQEGFHYPNWTAALTADYSAGNNLLITYRGGIHTQNQDNQGIMPPDASTYNFNYSNSRYASDPFYVANPDLIHSSGWTDAGTFREVKRRLQEKISNNIDVSYFLSWSGEHALKAGFGYSYLHEDVYEATTHPRVYMGWGRTTYALGDAIGVGADPTLPNDDPNPAYGQYGYYYIRGSWTQPVNGGAWNIHADNFSAYIQDSWTIKNRLTVNFGLRAESQYIPSMTTELYPDFTDKPIKFDMTDMLAPRLGVVYDVFGDSSLKVFGSYGIYYDVMKLYMAELTFGGWKRVQDYYSLNTPDYRLIAASGEFDDRTSQEAGGTYIGSLDFLPPSFGRVDPNLKPTAQREISFGAEKKLSENLSLSVRLVNKHLLRTIEDVGAWETVNNEDGTTSWTETFYVANPGYGWSLPESQGGKFSDTWTDPGEDGELGTEDDGQTYPMWATPKATRDYYGLNISLEKRFSHNWQGGINYTLSQVVGNYSGLASSDEVGGGVGRVGPNVEQYYDDYYIMYDAKGYVLNGPLGQDRSHYLKAYGSYAFPFGLTVGLVAYGRSGLPLTSKLYLNDRYIYPENRADRGRLPFTFWADLYLEYSLKIGAKSRAAINLQLNNMTNTRTVQSDEMTLNLDGIYATDAEILGGTLANNYTGPPPARGAGLFLDYVRKSLHLESPGLKKAVPSPPAGAPA
ncbi:MAG: carboxypeptidase regulatory-like domain-containing protein, partial [Candidatus Aminicenantes bacterium]|nr:carboxypeptidase regulatory-like domain-containing protein [Candidatus Aminicenantes bacterium]